MVPVCADKLICTVNALLMQAFLPPAYIVRRQGTVFTGVCLSTGGGQVQLAGGVRSSQGGGQVQLAGGVRSSQGGWGGSGPAAGGGSAKIAQHREYLLHGGRYASCVHAGGLSCHN